MPMFRIFLIASVFSIFVSCSPTKHLVNEWAIHDIKSLDESNIKVNDIIFTIKKEGYIHFTKDHKYFFATPYGISKGDWFFKPKNNEFLYTVSEEKDTVSNKVIKLTKENVIIESLDPKSRMVINLVPKQKK
jgi:hypothetical protein